MAWGEYPPEFNPRVHGPYDPSRYYGKPDTKLAQVKLGELGAWVGRRNFHPYAMWKCVHRAWWRYIHRWAFPRNAGLPFFCQFFFFNGLFWYFNDYRTYKHHRTFKHHW